MFEFAQDERRRLKNAIIIQSYVRGYQDLKKQVCLQTDPHPEIWNLALGKIVGFGTSVGLHNVKAMSLFPYIAEVDAFFVISGYLLNKLCLSNLNHGLE